MQTYYTLYVMQPNLFKGSNPLRYATRRLKRIIGCATASFAYIVPVEINRRG